MNISMVNPPWFFLKEMDYFPQNLGIRYLSSFLAMKGHRVDFIDSLDPEKSKIVERTINGKKVRQIGMDYDSICNLIPSDSDVIAMTVPFTFLKPSAEEFAKAAKKRFNVPIISGGVLPSTLSSKAAEFSDYAVRGEGEIPMARLLSGERPEKIKGFVSKKFDNGASEKIEDLDSIPFPYRGEEFEKHIHFSSRGRKDRRTASLITSRGCPYDCNFCSTHPAAGYKWRSRSIGNVMEEIKQLRDRFSIDHMEIEDDNFTLNGPRAKGLLEEIVRYNESGQMTFSVPNGLRIDTLDSESISLMKRAGFLSLYLALESGSPEILESMNKRLSLEKVREVAELASQNGLDVLYFLMIGYPGETRERFMESIRFCSDLKKIGNSRFTTFLARAYPGTRFFDQCKQNGYLSKSAEEEIFLGANYQIVTPDFDRAELEWRMKYSNETLNGGRKKDYII